MMNWKTISLFCAAQLAALAFVSLAHGQDRAEEISACVSQCEGEKTLSCEQQCHLASLAERGRGYIEMRDRALRLEAELNVCEGSKQEMSKSARLLDTCQMELAVTREKVERRVPKWMPWVTGIGSAVAFGAGGYLLGRAGLFGN